MSPVSSPVETIVPGVIDVFPRTGCVTEIATVNMVMTRIQQSTDVVCVTCRDFIVACVVDIM